ncbi:hypothetical protein LSG23_20350 (plasmid) [Bacillus velezensis]|uniref:hypothetical protein n=1 Tax=Bacillus velezensis TaxID=492670 RepID=UPI00098B22BC|nr:hypothetical protein [Bacillus velezensis]WNR83243.1 hypothetical protein RP314_20500 [Bacillus velezensis]
MLLGDFYSEYYIEIPCQDNQKGIADAYIEHIKQGFNLTAKEISSYLKVSELWVTRHVEAKYIWLNSTAKAALKRYYPDSEYKKLFKNKKLFKRSSFEFFVKQNIYYIIEPNKEKHTLDKLPSVLTTRKRALTKYNISYHTFYSRINQSAIKKYYILGQPRYSEHDLDHLFKDKLESLVKEFK